MRERTCSTSNNHSAFAAYASAAAQGLDVDPQLACGIKKSLAYCRISPLPLWMERNSRSFHWQLRLLSKLQAIIFDKNVTLILILGTA